MIVGIGIDIINISRIRRLENSAIFDKFVKRILLQTEIEILNQKKDKSRYLATRFAAKEAMSKAFGCGIGKDISFHDIEITSDTLGKPIAKITKQQLATPNFTGNSSDIKIHISISDEKNTAISQCLIEKM